MKPTPPEPPHDPAKDTGAYDNLPARTKELLNLEDQITKTTGQEKADLQKKAREAHSNNQRPERKRRMR